MASQKMNPNIELLKNGWAGNEKNQWAQGNQEFLTVKSVEQWQGFSQKAVQPSYGRPFLEETQGKFT